jgi:hypothetical protein
MEPFRNRVGYAVAPADTESRRSALHPRSGGNVCGIAGWVDFSRDLTQERASIAAMTETMACRGPDASGIWSDRNAALGRRRRAVIDIPGGAQPMSMPTPRGDVVVVYSGEAYNFKELSKSCVGSSSPRVRSSRPPATPRSSCADTCIGARRSRTGSTACMPLPSGTRVHASS